MCVCVCMCIYVCAICKKKKGCSERSECFEGKPLALVKELCLIKIRGQVQWDS